MHYALANRTHNKKVVLNIGILFTRVFNGKYWIMIHLADKQKSQSQSNTKYVRAQNVMLPIWSRRIINSQSTNDVKSEPSYSTKFLSSNHDEENIENNQQFDHESTDSKDEDQFF